MKNLLAAFLMLAIGGASFADLRPVELNAKAGRVVTNGDLTAERPFSLLIVHDGSRASAAIAQMVNQPGQYMRQWAQTLDVQLMDVRDEREAIVIKEQHGHLLSKHQYQLPIVALVDRTGGVWWSAAGGQIPTDESTFASTLGRYYAATLEAARVAGANPPTPANRPPVQSMQSNATANFSGGSYFMERGLNYARENRGGMLRGGLIDVPDKINTSVGLEGDTVRTLIGGGIIAIICCLIIAAGRVFSAQISANAITDDPDEGAN